MVELIVQIAHSDGTVTGQVTAPGAPGADFFGWLELMDRLERAVDRQEAMDGHNRTLGAGEKEEQRNDRSVKGQASGGLRRA